MMSSADLRPVRRSRRLQSLGADVNCAEDASHSRAGNAAEEPSNVQSSLLGLSPELRLHIYQYLIVDDRPFMIGRYSEERKQETRGGPRDVFIRKHKVHRDDRPHRPIQPPITRTCRLIREECLPLFYQENQFWLIHNEFCDENVDSKQPRRFGPWLEQTPSQMFDFMQHVSLCGYTDWPNRIMITFDLKHRKCIQAKEYSMYGDQLQTFEEVTRDVEKSLEEHQQQDGFTALKAVLAKYDGIFQLYTEHISAPPGISKTRKPMEGPEYDW